MCFFFKKMKRFIRNWVVPSGYLDLLKKTKRKEVKASSYPENRQFKNIHKGKRCFVLATGPSINTQDLTVLENEFCIAVGHFHLHKDISVIRPEYHILAPMHSPFDSSHSIKYFQDFITYYKGINVTYFLGVDNSPLSFSVFLNQYPQYKLDNVHYIDYSNHILLNEKNCNDADLWDITKEPFGMRSVVYGAVQLAHYMGFSEVYLLGCDHDYLLDYEKKESKHFYEYGKGIGDRKSFERYDTEYWFYEYYIRWRDFRLMRDYCAKHGTKIYNATNGGMLDVFERVNFKDILKQH